MRPETVEMILKWFKEGVSLAGTTSLIYMYKLEEGKSMRYMLMRKLVEKELARIQSGNRKKD